MGGYIYLVDSKDNNFQLHYTSATIEQGDVVLAFHVCDKVEDVYQRLQAKLTSSLTGTKEEVIALVIETYRHLNCRPVVIDDDYYQQLVRENVTVLKVNPKWWHNSEYYPNSYLLQKSSDSTAI